MWIICKDVKLHMLSTTDMFSKFFQQVAGGAGGTDETGTNKDTHQLSVIWKQDAVSTYLPPNFCSSCYYQAVSGDSGRPT